MLCKSDEESQNADHNWNEADDYCHNGINEVALLWNWISSNRLEMEYDEDGKYENDPESDRVYISYVFPNH